MYDLQGEVLAGHSRDGTALALVAEVAKEADELIAVSAERGNVVPLVVGVGAREGLAARHGVAGVHWEDHLHTLVVVGVDNGRDVKVGCAGEAVEANLTEHTGNIWLALRDGVPVASPAGREGLVGSGHAWDDELRNGLETEIRGEDDGALGVVLVDKVDRASRSEGCKRGGCEDGAEELHVVDWARIVFVIEQVLSSWSVGLSCLEQEYWIDDLLLESWRRSIGIDGECSGVVETCCH